MQVKVEDEVTVDEESDEEDVEVEEREWGGMRV